jgi:hypothetical protein
MFRRAVGQGSLYWLACRDSAGAYLKVATAQEKAALRSLFEDVAADGRETSPRTAEPRPARMRPGRRD